MRLLRNWHETWFLIAMIVSLPIGPVPVCAANEVNSSAGLAVYSDMNFIATEGEFSGLQIVLIPYDDNRKRRRRVLFRSAGPFLDPPLLLDATEEEKALKIVVPPSSDLAGAWTLSLKGSVIEAVGPRGLKYSLKKISVK